MPELKVPLPRDQRGPRLARKLVTEQLVRSSTPHRCVEDAVLLVSELVTNALVHGRGDIRLECTVDGTLARVAISDAEVATPQLRRPTSDRPSGRGLLLVDLLAARWGVDAAPTGKTVWFEIEW